MGKPPEPLPAVPDPGPAPGPGSDPAQATGATVGQGDAVKRMLDVVTTIRDRAHALFTGPGKWATPAPGTDLRVAVYALGREIGTLRQQLDDAATAELEAALAAGVALDVAEGRIGQLREEAVILLTWASKHRGEGSETVRPADLPAEFTGDIPEAHNRWNALWAEWSERSCDLRDAAASVVRLRMATAATPVKTVGYAAGTTKSPQQAVGEVERPRGRRRRSQQDGTVNQQILGMLRSNPESMSWPLKEWADRLDCSRGTVAGTDAWQTVMQARAIAESERKEQPHRTNDRRRKPKKH